MLLQLAKMHLNNDIEFRNAKVMILHSIPSFITVLLHVVD